MATSNNNKALNVPHLRFPEFTGEWRYSSLGKECNILCGYPFDGQDMQESCGNVKLLRGINITEGEIRHSNELDRYYSGDTSRLGKYILKEGDLVIGMDGSKVGRNSAILTICEQGSYLVQRVCRIRSQKHNVEYIFQHINNSKFHRHVDSVKTASAIPHISQSDIQDYVVSFPPTAEEQIKITSLLSLLDARIATQNKIIEKLKTLIKALSHKLTTQKKPNTLLKDCLVGHSSTLLESHIKGKGQYPVFGATGICGYTDKSDISGDSILIIKDGAGVGTTTYATGKYSVIGTLNYLQSTQEHYSLLYIYYSLKTFDFRPYITGMAIPHIYFRDYGKAKIWCPDIVEQKRIATVLRTMDAKLQTEQSILWNLTSQKQYFLSQIFI